MMNNDLFGTSSPNEMVKYSQGSIVDGRYSIISPIIPILGGNLYKAYEVQGTQINTSKLFLIIQMEGAIHCANYAKEGFKPIQNNEAKSFRGGEFVLDITGYEFLEEYLTRCRQEMDYKKIFIQLMQWLNQFHSTPKQVFPFLHFRNVLVSQQNIKVLGTSFQYDYFNCKNNPYPYLISPNYISFQRQQSNEYKNISDHYAIAMMLWQSVLKRSPRWDEHSFQFDEEVQAGIFTEFIKIFLDGSYLKSSDDIIRVLENSIALALKPTSPTLSSIPNAYSSPTNMATPSPLSSSNQRDTNQRDTTVSDRRIKLLEDKDRQWQEKEKQWQREHAELLEKQTELQYHHKKEIFRIKAIAGFGILSVLIAGAVLFLLGFRMITPETITQHSITRVQKDSWYILGLIQSQKFSTAQEFCLQWASLPDRPLLSLYFQTIASIYESSNCDSSERKTELRNLIMNNLSVLRSSTDKLNEESQLYQIPIAMEQIETWAKAYLK